MFNWIPKTLKLASTSSLPHSPASSLLPVLGVMYVMDGSWLILQTMFSIYQTFDAFIACCRIFNGLDGILT